MLLVIKQLLVSGADWPSPIIIRPVAIVSSPAGIKGFRNNNYLVYYTHIWMNHPTFGESFFKIIEEEQTEIKVGVTMLTFLSKRS